MLSLFTVKRKKSLQKQINTDMKAHINSLLFWTPRVACIILAFFICLLALGVFGEQPGFWTRSLIVQLIPTFLMVTTLALTWKHEWFGGMIFILMGTIYMIVALNHADIVLLISVPLLLIGALLLVAWYQRRVIDPRISR
jgi:hypothetical protein